MTTDFASTFLERPTPVGRARGTGLDRWPAPRPATAGAAAWLPRGVALVATTLLGVGLAALLLAEYALIWNLVLARWLETVPRVAW